MVKNPFGLYHVAWMSYPPSPGLSQMRTLTTSSQLIDFLDWPFHQQVLSRIFWKAGRFRPAPIGAAGFVSEPGDSSPQRMGWEGVGGCWSFLRHSAERIVSLNIRSL